MGLVQLIRFLQMLLKFFLGVPTATGHLPHLTGGLGPGRGYIGP